MSGGLEEGEFLASSRLNVGNPLVEGQFSQPVRCEERSFNAMTPA
jgi:hypothetical protein